MILCSPAWSILTPYSPRQYPYLFILKPHAIILLLFYNIGIFGGMVLHCCAITTIYFSRLSLTSYQAFITFKLPLGRILLMSLWLLGDAQEEMVFQAFHKLLFISVQQKVDLFLALITVHLQISCVLYHWKNLYLVGHEINVVVILTAIMEGCNNCLHYLIDIC